MAANFRLLINHLLTFDSPGSQLTTVLLRTTQTQTTNYKQFIPDRLLPLCLSDLRLLVPLGQDVLQSCSLDRPLELDIASCSFLGDLLLRSLPVLATVENSPGDFTGIAPHKESILGFFV